MVNPVVYSKYSRNVSIYVASYLASPFLFLKSMLILFMCPPLLCAVHGGEEANWLQLLGCSWLLEPSSFQILVPSEWPGGLVTKQAKTQTAGLYPYSFWFSRSGAGLRIFISSTFPGGADVAGLFHIAYMIGNVLTSLYTSYYLNFRWWWDELGDWDWRIYTNTYKKDN